MENNKNITEDDVLNMMNDTSKLFAEKNAERLSEAAIAFNSSENLVNNVEFWKWLDKNYSNSGIFSNPESMNQYISQGIGKEEWVAKQLQGKGYEWDWMSKQRNDIRNIFNKYDAGDVVNRAASDVTETNMLTGKTKEYQMKAYTSKTNPHLKNTSKDITVVTNSEKTDIVKNNGYDVEEFQNNKKINKNKEERLEQVKKGKAYPEYNIKNVGGAMLKSGICACVAGMGMETVFSYKAWKNGQITKEEYLERVLNSGGNAGVTASLTTGVMIPVKVAITAMGASNIITIPVAFVVGGLIDKIVAPCFKRGKYREILNSAKYYQNLEHIYDDLASIMEVTANQYVNFVNEMQNQKMDYQKMQNTSMEINKELKALYDGI